MPRHEDTANEIHGAEFMKELNKSLEVQPKVPFTKRMGAGFTKFMESPMALWTAGFVDGVLLTILFNYLS